MISLRALFASPFGFGIGFALGAFGGGGSILTIPILVFIAGQPTNTATSTSLLIVGISALIGIIPYQKQHAIRWKTGLFFSVFGIAGSFVGSYVHDQLNEHVLLFFFACFMFIVAYSMCQKNTSCFFNNNEFVLPATTTDATVSSTPVLTKTQEPTSIFKNTAILVFLTGIGVGFLTGIFGVGGGFIIVPALLFLLRFSMTEAVGTSLLIIASNSFLSFLSHGNFQDFDWWTLILFCITTIIGVLVGSRYAASKDTDALQKWFILLIFGVAGYTALVSLTHLII